MNKKAQFYFIAAIIIVVILSGLAGISNYAISKSKSTLSGDFGLDLKREAYYITEYGIYNNRDVKGLLENFTGEQFGNFFLKNSKDSNIFFLFGNKSGMTALQYTEGEQGEVISGGSILGSSSWNETGFIKMRDITAGDLLGKSLIDININNNDYTFEIREGEMFYFVIVEKRDGETFIEVSL